jgi:hypothetical protein
MAALWRRPRLAGAPVRPLPPRLQAILLSPWLRVALGAVSVALFTLVSLAALLGERSPTQNLAPTFVWVVFWLGLVPVVVVFGNVWRVLSPWAAVADSVAWAWHRSGRSWEPPWPYPAAAGRWPATAFLFAFTALELAYTNPADPPVLALAIYLYSAATWSAMLAHGREAWLENGEAFNVYFGLLGRLAPFGVRKEDGQREIVVRPPLTGLAEGEPRRGTLPFVAVMLGSVAFDSVGRTSWWTERRFSLTADLISESPGLADTVAMLFNLAGLASCVALVAASYLAAVWAARVLGASEKPLGGAFLGSLVPIALAYAVAHYFSLLVLQGQLAIPLLSDPFGWGWDLFGTADFRPNLRVLTPSSVWYVQVGALVVGHVLGLVLAHDRAVSLFSSAGRAVRTQYALLALMVLYTVGGLWLLSSG